MNDREIVTTLRHMNENMNTDHDVANFFDYLRRALPHATNDKLARMIAVALYAHVIENTDPDDAIAALADNDAFDFDSLPDEAYID